MSINVVMKYCFLRWIGAMAVLLFISSAALAQEPPQTDTVDAIIILRKILKKEQKERVARFTILPSISYNPTYGLSGGANATGVFKAGDAASTPFSVALANLYVSTKSVVNLQVRHNLFSNKGKMYFLGDFQIGKLITPTYYPGDNESKYEVRYQAFRFSERVYARVKGPFYAGAGLAIESYGKINDEKLNTSAGETTPHYDYSIQSKFPYKSYNANGLSINLLYYTMEHPVRSYGGMFADFVLKMNQEWMGSTAQAINFSTDIRKYWSLSKRNPEHVLAFWQSSTFRLDGKLPYINLPGTGLDQYNRSGRAYTFGRFKGPSFVYLESEYRFPITRNKFFSGVAFVNMQSTSDSKNYGLLRVIQPAAGAGLRVLLNKRTRSNLCLDYAIGLNGDNGLFFGLNEAF